MSSLGFLALAAVTAGPLMIESSMAKENRPDGFVRPSNPALEGILANVEKGQFDEALTAIAKTKVNSGSMDSAWLNYFGGLALFGKKELDQGYAKLLAVHEFARSSRGSHEPDLFRLAGAALKKVGWYFRTRKEFDRAYAYHSIEMSYFEKYGSPLEVHDAAISLDVDSYSMEDMHLSEIWLRRSLDAAGKIRESKSKNQSLGTSFNNLAGTLCSLGRFEEAEDSIKKALEFWKAYEVESGPRELKVVWAYFGIGDVYQEWSNFLKKQGKDYQQKKVLSLEAFRASLTLAEKLGTPSDGKKSIQDRIAAVMAL